MSEVKFTKGEWSVIGEIVIADKGAVVIKPLASGKITPQEDEANADLISAAPEMYEEIESEIEFLRELRSEAHTPYMAELFDNRIADKVNLLAKARGEK